MELKNIKKRTKYWTEKTKIKQTTRG